MPEFIPVSLDMPAASDRRIGHMLGSRPDARGVRVVLLGFPTDEGVARNQGRIGAAKGSAAIRHCLYRFTADPRYPPMDDLFARSRDLGDLKLPGDLETDQEQLGEAVGQILAAGEIPVVLGGGHETAYGHFLGYVKADLPVVISNLDAHADVRELRDGLGHSGSPFRQALEHKSDLCRGYQVAGLQPQSVSREHLSYLSANNCRYWFRHETDQSAFEHLYPREGNTYATFCLDAVDAAFAPGVSAPATDGLTPQFWLQAAEAAGRAASVRSFDVVELNPSYDIDNRSARLAALTVWHFLRGLAIRA